MRGVRPPANQVTCEAYGSSATTADIMNSVLGTVDDEAVYNTLETEFNPEGAEPISGTTGTPRS